MDEEINKSYAWLSKRNIQNHLPINLVQSLDIDRIIEQIPTKKYRSIYYPFSALIKLFIFMKLTGINNQSRMERYLKKHPRDKKKLGLKRVPDQTMISKFTNHYLTNETKETIDYIVDKIKTVAKEFKIDLGIKQQKERKIFYPSTKSYILEREMTKAAKELKKLLKDSEFIKIRRNSAYSLEDYLDLLIEMALKNTFAKTAARQLRRNRLGQRKFCLCKKCGKSLLYPSFSDDEEPRPLNYLYCSNPKCGHRERIAPSGEMLHEHLDTKFETIEQLLRHFRVLFEKIWERTKKYNLFNEPVNIAIDRTDASFYGDIDEIGIQGKEPKDGTAWGYAFYTVYVSKPGRRYTLYTLPLLKHRAGIPESLFLYNQNIVLKQLLLMAKQKVKIRYVLFDNAFCTAETINLIKELGLKCLTIAKKGEKKILKDTENVPSHTIISNYRFGNSTITVFTLRKLVTDRNNRKNPREKKKVNWRYVTNEEATGDSNEWVGTMAALYPKRWGIESSYDKIKNDFRLRCRSKNYIIRLFYFEFLVLFYNLWVYANILVCFSLFNDIRDDPIVIAKDFEQIILQTDPG